MSCALELLISVPEELLSLFELEETPLLDELLIFPSEEEEILA